MLDRIILEPGHRDRYYWRDLWRHRELFLVLAKRDLSVRYKQTVIGIAWAVLKPVLTVAAFTIVFGRIAQLPSDGGAPYALMVLAGLLPWTLFSTGLSEASNSLVNNANLIGKVYFPRLIVPAASVAVTLADFLIGLLVLMVLFVWYGFAPGWPLVLLPAFTILIVLATIGPALWVASLNVRYRDFRYGIPFAVQVGLYVSPVGFSSNAIAPQWRLLYSLNPIVGVIDGFRWSILAGRTELYPPAIAISLGAIVFGLWLGLRRFRKTEATFADLI